LCAAEPGRDVFRGCIDQHLRQLARPGRAFRLSFNFGLGCGADAESDYMLPQYWHTEAYMPEDLKYERILQHLRE